MYRSAAKNINVGQPHQRPLLGGVLASYSVGFGPRRFYGPAILYLSLFGVHLEDHGPEQTGTTRRYGSLPTGSHHTTGSLLMPARTNKDYPQG